jgi:hypothetical protein
MCRLGQIAAVVLILGAAISVAAAADVRVPAVPEVVLAVGASPSASPSPIPSLSLPLALRSPPQSPPDESPPLTMVWRETRHVPPPQQAVVRETFRLEYHGRCRYRVTEVSFERTPPQPGAPNVAGSTYELDGQTVRSNEPWRGPHETVKPIDPMSCFTPTMYLLIPMAMPPFVPMLAARPDWHATDLGNDLARLSHDEEHPANGRILHEHVEVTYRLSDGLPMLIVLSIDGIEVQRREVLELRDDAP